jgi:two-component system LytT family response regulator
MTLRAIIVDDEPPARRRIRRLLATEPDVVVTGECGDGESALQLVARERPDLLFLDVQMPERGGFEVVAALPEAPLPAILFVTAHDRYALRAFDVHAVDYLLKPFTAERFRTALARARERIAHQTADAGLASLAASLRARPAYLSRVAVRAGSRTLFVDLTSVDWMDAADNYVRLHVGRRELLVRDTLASLEAQLDPDRFVRVHRSAIVQTDRVTELRAQSHGDAEVLLRDGTVVPVSRTWRERLQQAIGRR